MLGMEPHRYGWISGKEVREKVLKAIAHFEHPEIKPETRVMDLSLSAQQLVEIGRSLAVGCRVLVFDEPTSSLSQKDSQRLFEIIRDLRDKGLSIVYISHFREEVEEIADRLTVLRDGRVTGSQRVGSIAIDDIVEMMVGRSVKEMYLRSSRNPGKPVPTGERGLFPI